MKLPIEIISLIIDFSEKNDIRRLKLTSKKLHDSIMQYRLSNGLTRIKKFDAPELLKIATSAKINYRKVSAFFNYNCLANIRNLYLTKMDKNLMGIVNNALQKMNIYKLKLCSLFVPSANIIIPNSVRYLELIESEINNLIVNPDSKLSSIEIENVDFQENHIIKNMHKLKYLNKLSLNEVIYDWDSSNIIITMPRKLDYLEIFESHMTCKKLYDKHDIKNVDLKFNNNYICDMEIFKNTENLTVFDTRLVLNKDIVLDKLVYLDICANIDANIEFNGNTLSLPNLEYLDSNIESKYLDVNPYLSKLACVYPHVDTYHQSISKYQFLKYLRITINRFIIVNDVIKIDIPGLEHLYINNRVKKSLTVKVNCKSLQTLYAYNTEFELASNLGKYLNSLKLVDSKIDHICYDYLETLHLINANISNLDDIYHFQLLRFIKIYQKNWQNIEIITNQKLIENDVFYTGPMIDHKK